MSRISTPVIVLTCACVFAVVVVATVGASTDDTASRARTLNLVAIGDSVPYGQQDCGFCLTFVDRFGKALSRAIGAKVRVSNLSEHTGIDSTDLRKELAASKPLRAAIARADAITVTIGHNDPPWNRDDDPCDGAGGYPKADWSKYDASCVGKTAATYAANLDTILRQIRALHAGEPTLLRVTDDYNDIIGDPAVPQSAYSVAKPFFDTYSAATCRIAKKYKAICIDTYHAFNGSPGTRDAGALLAGDHTHTPTRVATYSSRDCCHKLATPPCIGNSRQRGYARMRERPLV